MLYFIVFLAMTSSHEHFIFVSHSSITSLSLCCGNYVTFFYSFFHLLQIYFLIPLHPNQGPSRQMVIIILEIVIPNIKYVIKTRKRNIRIKSNKKKKKLINMQSKCNHSTEHQTSIINIIIHHSRPIRQLHSPTLTSSSFSFINAKNAKLYLLQGLAYSDV